jgi:hypothetical protein
VIIFFSRLFEQMPLLYSGRRGPDQPAVQRVRTQVQQASAAEGVAMGNERRHARVGGGCRYRLNVSTKSQPLTGVTALEAAPEHELRDSSTAREPE